MRRGRRGCARAVLTDDYHRRVLRTEADVIRTLERGTYTLEELYEKCASSADIARGDGHRPPSPRHMTDRVWKRRVRSALMRLKESGRAERMDQSVWAIRGEKHQPRTLMLVLAGGELGEVELSLSTAVELLASLDEPADLVICDPPWGLDRDRSGRFRGGRGYRRDHLKVLGGYRDVDPAAYREFTLRWVTAAADALRPGGQLAVITGPQQAALAQISAEEAGLSWVSQIVARKVFPLKTTRRPSAAHWCVTVMCNGRLYDPRRVFNCPPDLPLAATGATYPLSWWEDNGRADRPGLLRYDNSLPLKLVGRLVEAFSDPGELVVDPMVGSGTTAIACLRAGRRFSGSDVNPEAIKFAASRLLAEHEWATEHTRRQAA